MLNVVMLSVIMLSVVMLSVVMLIVVMLTVLAQFLPLKNNKNSSITTKRYSEPWGHNKLECLPLANNSSLV